MTLRRRMRDALPARRSSGGAGAVDALRETWSTYPAEWKRDADLNLGAATLGEEWGGPAFADLIAGELVAPYLGADVDVLELGCGGGKFSHRLAPRCRSLLCTDISQAMIDHASQTVADHDLGANVDYRVLNGVDFTGVPDDSVDFVFSYDVQLHLQPQNVFSYMLDAKRVLRRNGVFMLHQVNLATEGGMWHFLTQYSGATWQRDFDDPRRRGHIYFMSEDQMWALADEAGMPIERLVVAEQPVHRAVTGGRDLIGFLRTPVSRLRDRDPSSIDVVRVAGAATVWAVIDGHRAAFMSQYQFTRAGLSWDRVREITAEELAAIPEAEALHSWE